MIELDFIPDLIIYFELEEKNHKMKYLYGNNILYDMNIDYISSLVSDRKSCMVFIQKSTLKFKVCDCKIE